MAYGQSKLANILFSNELARRLADDSGKHPSANGRIATSNAVHPGLVKSELRRHVDEFVASHWLLKLGTFLNVFVDLAEMTTEMGALTQVVRFLCLMLVYLLWSCLYIRKYALSIFIDVCPLLQCW